MVSIKAKKTTATFECPNIKKEVTCEIEYSYTSDDGCECCGSSYVVYFDTVDCPCGFPHEITF